MNNSTFIMQDCKAYRAPRNLAFWLQQGSTLVGTIFCLALAFALIVGYGLIL